MSIPFTWVYLIFDPFTELFKIGKSDNPEVRLRQLRAIGSGQTLAAAPADYRLIEAWLIRWQRKTSRLHNAVREYERERQHLLWERRVLYRLLKDRVDVKSIYSKMRDWRSRSIANG